MEVDYTELTGYCNAVRYGEPEDAWVYRVFLYRNDINFYVCKVDGSTDEYAWQYATSIEESLKD